ADRGGTQVEREEHQSDDDQSGTTSGGHRRILAPGPGRGHIAAHRRRGVRGLRQDGHVGEVARHIDDAERRARLGVRHALAVPVADTLAAARALTCLHATEPASVHLAAWARAGVTRDDIDDALYVQRSVVKQLAMPRTVFAF